MAGLPHSTPQPANLALWADGDPSAPAGSSSVPTDSQGGSAAAADTEDAAMGAGGDCTSPAAPDAAVGRICQAGSGLWHQGPPQGTVLIQQAGLPQQQGQAGGISGAAHQVVCWQPAQSQATRGSGLGLGASDEALQSSALEAQDADCVHGRMHSSRGHVSQAGRSAEACQPTQRPAAHGSGATQTSSAASTQSQLLRGQQQPPWSSIQACCPAVGDAAVARVGAWNPGSHAGVCCCNEVQCMRPAWSQSILNAGTLWVA